MTDRPDWIVGADRAGLRDRALSARRSEQDAEALAAREKASQPQYALNKANAALALADTLLDRAETGHGVGDDAWLKARETITELSSPGDGPDPVDAAYEAGRVAGLEEAAGIAAFLQICSPDGGSPTAEGCAVAKEAERAIRALINKENRDDG